MMEGFSMLWGVCEEGGMVPFIQCSKKVETGSRKGTRNTQESDKNED